MSTLVTSNISDGSTSVGTSYVVNGSAKAWVNFNGTGTVAIRDSLNVSSLTDNGTGDYTVNFSSAFGAADYVSISSAADASGSTSAIITLDIKSLADVSTGSCRFNAKYVSSSTSYFSDWALLNTSIHGDLA